MAIDAGCSVGTANKLENFARQAVRKYPDLQFLYISEADALSDQLQWTTDLIPDWRIFRFPISDGRAHVLMHRDCLFVKDICTRNRCIRGSVSNSSDVTGHSLCCFFLHGSQTAEEFATDLGDLSILHRKRRPRFSPVSFLVIGMLVFQSV